MIELLAPAGSIDSLKAAVYNGADAVYLGLEQFNARIKADNFSTHNLRQWVDFCHLYNVKVHVTLNTAVKNTEMDELTQLIKVCADARVDAFILSDLAVLSIARTYAPKVALHASTQLGIHNLYGARYAQRLGFSRVVLSRESRLEDIRAIKENTTLEVECFAHGALCVSFSGGCLMSSVAGGNSGNRGLCLQPCRKEYTETLSGQKGYFLSMKDLCTLPKLEDYIRLGVDSLKIEGRLKSPEYVGETIRTYRKAIDDKSYSAQDLTNLKKLFNRGGYTTGYAYESGSELMSTQFPSHIGIEAGIILDCKPYKEGYALVVESKYELVNGSGCKVISADRERGGFEVSIIEKKENKYKLFSTKPYRAGDIIRITSDAILREEILSRIKKIPIEANLHLRIGHSPRLCMSARAVRVEVENEFIVTQANTNPINYDTAFKQISKLGDTHFTISNFSLDVEGDVFVPNGVLNALRRECADRLERALLNMYNNIYDSIVSSDNNAVIKLNQAINRKSLIAEINETTQIEPYVLRDCDIVLNYPISRESILRYGVNDNNIYIKLPKIVLSKDISLILEDIKTLPDDIGIYADNIYALEIAYVTNRKVLGGFGLNVFNRLHAQSLGVSDYCISAELSHLEIVTFDKSVAIYAFGRLPLMTLAHCPIQNIKKCKCNKCEYKDFSLVDSFGEFPIRRTKVVNCSFVLKNNALTNISDAKLYGKYVQYLDFSEKFDYNTIIQTFKRGEKYFSDGKTTKGHFSKGVK